MKPIFRLFLVMSIITFAITITAGSCDDDAGGGNNNNNNNNNSGGDKPVVLGPVDPVIKITAVQSAVTANLVKIDESGNVKVNAKTLEDKAGPYNFPTTANATKATVTNAVRYIEEKSVNLPALFTIEVMRNSTNAAEGGMVWLMDSGLTKNTVAFKNTADSLVDASDGTSKGIWRRSVAAAGGNPNFYQLVSFMEPFGGGIGRDVQVQGRVICPTEKHTGVHDAATATEATKLSLAKATCHIASQELHNTGSVIDEISEAWVDRSGTVKEVEFRVMAVYTGDTGLGALSGTTGWTKASFFGALDNTAMQGIFTKNKYVEKTFKIKIVKNANF